MPVNDVHFGFGVYLVSVVIVKAAYKRFFFQRKTIFLFECFLYERIYGFGIVFVKE